MKFIYIFCLSLLARPLWAQTSITAPNISANALVLYQNSNFNKEDTSTTRNGLDLEEAEVNFYADVDPYSRLNMVLAIHPEYELDATTNKVEQSWVIEPEEAYVETNHIPSTTIRLGKIKAAFGKHNLLHTHVFPFIDAPVANTTLLGDEGLNDMGLSVAYLLPLSWYSEVTAQYLRGEGENSYFSSPTPNDAVILGRFKNLWDLSTALTMEAGLSYAQGNNSLNGQTKLMGADLTFKWRPESGGKYHSWILASEYIDREQDQLAATAEKGSGYNVWGQYQFAERWAVAARYDSLKVKDSNTTLNPNALDNITTNKYSTALIFNATEFSSYRLEYNSTDGPLSAQGESKEHKIYLQANFTIGAHPAHSY